MTKQTEAPVSPKRMTLSNVVERLTEKRSTSSVTLKLSAQGQFMPELTVAANDDAAAITAMVDSAIAEFTRLFAQAWNGGK